MVVLCALVAPAAAEKRVALLAIGGDGGDDVTIAVAQVLNREVTVLSLTRLDDEAVSRVAAELRADAIVSGTWRPIRRRRWRLTLVVREGRTGKVAGRAVFRVRRLDRAKEDEIAARLLPMIQAIPPLPAAETEAETEIVTEPDSTNTELGTPSGSAPDVGPEAAALPETVSAPESTTEADAESGSEPEAEAEAASETEADDEADVASESEPDAEPEESEGDFGIGPIGGRTFAYVRAPLEDEPFQQVSASMWLNARPRFSDNASASFELAFDGIETSQTEQTGLRVDLREAYVSLRKRGWLLRAGRQILPWGSSDVVNPTDFLTARDYGFFVVDAEQSRKGALSLLVAHATPRLEVKLVATPRFPASSVLVPSTALPAGVSLAEPAVIPAELRNTEVAGKIKLSGRGWDIAAVGFRGWNHTPELELVSATDTGVVLRHTHRRIVAAGVDGSASIGKLVFRVEAAYIVPTANRDGADATRLPPEAFGVLGLERPLGERLRVQAQVLTRAYPKWTDPATVMGPDPETTAALQGLAAANALLLDYQNELRPAATLRLAYQSEEGRLEAEVFGAVNFVGHDYLVRPLIGWRPVELVTLQLGVDVYGGPSDRPLGALAAFRGGFGQVTYVF